MNNAMVTTSQRIADYFGKSHSDVIEIIKNRLGEADFLAHVKSARKGTLYILEYEAFMSLMPPESKYNNVVIEGRITLTERCNTAWEEISVKYEQLKVVIRGDVDIDIQ